MRFDVSTGAYSFWIDGVKVIDQSGGHLGGWTQGLLIGRDDDCMIGNIREVTLWNRPIIDTEIATLAGGAFYPV